MLCLKNIYAYYTEIKRIAVNITPWADTHF